MAKTEWDIVRTHVQAICAEAGLSVMEEIYEIVEERGYIDTPALLALDAGTVIEHYERYIGPALDHIEVELGDDDA